MMSALPARQSAMIDDQDHAHQQIRALLESATSALLHEAPGLVAFTDRRPQRDRPSGMSWRGLETMCHVSALLASQRPPAPASGSALIESVRPVAAAHGLAPRGSGLTLAHAGMPRMVWGAEAGDLLELVVGVRVKVRAVSAPFLPGSLEPPTTTSPVSPLSPLTPPPRPL